MVWDHRAPGVRSVVSTLVLRGTLRMAALMHWRCNPQSSVQGLAAKGVISPAAAGAVPSPAQQAQAAAAALMQQQLAAQAALQQAQSHIKTEASAGGMWARKATACAGRQLKLCQVANSWGVARCHKPVQHAAQRVLPSMAAAHRSLLYRR